MTAITSLSNFAAQISEATPKAAEATIQQGTPAQDAAPVPADGTPVTRSSLLPNDSALPANIALQLMQRPVNNAQPDRVQSEQNGNRDHADGQGGGKGQGTNAQGQGTGTGVPAGMSHGSGRVLIPEEVSHGVKILSHDVKTLTSDGIFAGKAGGFISDLMPRADVTSFPGAADIFGDIGGWMKDGWDNFWHDQEIRNAANDVSKHLDDPEYLLNKYGAEKLGEILSYLYNEHMGPSTLTHPYDPGPLQQKIENLLSNLAKSGHLSQDQMNQLCDGWMARSKDMTGFVQNVLSKASPEVQKMFYEWAKNYALAHQGTDEGKRMAACAMQALSQIKDDDFVIAELSSLSQNGQLDTLMQMAMEGEADNAEQIRRTLNGDTSGVGSWRPASMSQVTNNPLNGVETLMSRVGQSGNEDLSAHMFETAMNILEYDADPNVKSFYNQSGDCTKMKDALCLVFQAGYDKIVKDYDKMLPDPSGFNNFSKFFEYAVFTPPLGKSENAVGAVTKVINGPPTMLGGEALHAMVNGLIMAINSAGDKQAQQNKDDKFLIKILGEIIGVFSKGKADDVVNLLSDLLNGLIDSHTPEDAVNALILYLQRNGIPADPDGITAAATSDPNSSVSEGWKKIKQLEPKYH